ncbi:MAG: heparinase II/III family protein [Bacteroidetes bacterium]|nr:heparinase II/III family protein [Bacteroidota bacterium]
MRYVLFLVVFFFGARALSQVVPRHLLEASISSVPSVLKGQEEWRPFPLSPAEWRGVVADSVVARVVAAGERYASFEFKPIPATLFLEYVRTGNRVRYEKVSFEKRNALWALILAESAEGKGRFVDKILDGVWSICEETYWGLPPHVGIQKAGMGLPDVEDPTVDLFAAETAAVLAWTDYFVGGKLDSVSGLGAGHSGAVSASGAARPGGGLVRERIYAEVRRRVLEPMKTAKYGYLGAGRTDVRLSNWAPWVMSNYLTAALLLEKDKAQRVQAVQTAMHYTSLYIDGLGDDGGCEEGPGYWTAAGACVFDVLNLLYDATGGKVSIYGEPIIRRMGAYIYETHIAGKYFVNVGDGPPELVPSGEMIYRFGRSMGDSLMQGFGSWLVRKYPVPVGLGGNEYEQFHRTRRLYDLVAEGDAGRGVGLAMGSGKEPAVKEAWLGDLQLLVVRSRKVGNLGELFLATHGGNNGESHNHNDVGDFMVYKDGEPVIVDVGSGTYTSKTFSSHRYELWFNTSAYHNLPTVNGFQQKEGKVYAASSVEYVPGKSLKMEIGGAYPVEAGLVGLKRTLFWESGAVAVADEYKWKGEFKSLTQSFMTVCAVRVLKAGFVEMRTESGKIAMLQYEPKVWEVGIEKVEMGIPEEENVRVHWRGRPVYRVVLTAKRRVGKASFLVY